MNRQSEPPHLRAQADKCIEKLRVLKLRIQQARSHRTYSTRSFLTGVERAVDNNQQRLQTWITEFSKGRQTKSEVTLEKVASLFKILRLEIKATRDALDKRLLCRRLFLIGFIPGQRNELQNDVERALGTVKHAIGELHGQNKLLLVTPNKQADRQSKTLAFYEGLIEPYNAFSKFFEDFKSKEVQTVRSAVFGLLWEWFPRCPPDLVGKAGNALEPNDGLVYDVRQVEKAKAILVDLHSAWSDKGDTEVHPPPSQLPNMAMICLILTGMQQQHLLDDFLDKNVVDDQLPIDKEGVKTILSGENSKHAATFFTEQHRVAPRRWDEGHHLVIEEEEPLPFVHKAHYSQGSYGTVQQVQDPFTEALYAQKEQRIGAEEEENAAARKHLEEETKRLKDLRHKHVVQLVKSYQRGGVYGIILRPAATCDLERLIRRFDANKYDSTKDCKDREWIRPIFMCAFGCLSKGLAYIHDRKIRHKDIKPANILYERAKKDNGNEARLLWADFGLAYDFNETGNSKTRSTKIYSQRYAAPEIVSANTRVVADRRDSVRPDCDILVEDDKVLVIDEGHGRKTDVFSLGCVFLELLARLVEEKLPLDRKDARPAQVIPDDGAPKEVQMFSQYIPDLTNWASQRKRLEPDGKLATLFDLAVRMISDDADKRPHVDDVVQSVAEASRQHFCDACWQSTEKGQEAREEPIKSPLRSSSGNVAKGIEHRPRKGSLGDALEKVSAATSPHFKRILTIEARSSD